MKKTKIVATLGPSSSDSKVIGDMITAGLNVARLNFSHGTHASMEHLLASVRSLSEKLSTPVAVMADLQGPKIRLGDFDGKRHLSVGQEVVLSVSPKGDDLPIQFDLSRFVVEGQRVFINDGLIELVVTAVDGQAITAQVKSAGDISSHKGLNIPDTRLGVAAFTEKDQADAEFALKHGVDYIALSFVEHASDLKPLQDLVANLSPQTKIVVKIERREALNNLEKIIDAADAVMVARGDLATETSPSEIPIFQQMIIRQARQAHKPVIVATQMLESMTENPRPTRAETSDVANAVFIQADAVMLSGETATGKFPVEAVKTMTDVIISVEEHPDLKQYIRIDWDNFAGKNLEINALAASAASLAFRINSPLIAVATASGKTATIISSFRPSSNILAITHDTTTQNQLALLWGVTPIVLDPAGSSDAFWKNITQAVTTSHLVEPGHDIVLLGGSGNIGVPGATDTIKIVSV